MAFLHFLPLCSRILAGVFLEDFQVLMDFCLMIFTFFVFLALLLVQEFNFLEEVGVLFEGDL
jgi:hypothetical protein